MVAKEQHRVGVLRKVSSPNRAGRQFHHDTPRVKIERNGIRGRGMCDRLRITQNFCSLRRGWVRTLKQCFSFTDSWRNAVYYFSPHFYSAFLIALSGVHSRNIHSSRILRGHSLMGQFDAAMRGNPHKQHSSESRTLFSINPPRTPTMALAPAGPGEGRCEPEFAGTVANTRFSRTRANFHE